MRASTRIPRFFAALQQSPKEVTITKELSVFVVRNCRRIKRENASHAHLYGVDFRLAQ